MGISELDERRDSPKALIAYARLQLVEQHKLIVHRQGVDMKVFNDTCVLVFNGGQLVEMRGEQAEAFDVGADIMGHRPGQTESIVGGLERSVGM